MAADEPVNPQKSISYDPHAAVRPESAAFVARFEARWPAWRVAAADCPRLRRLSVTFWDAPVDIREAQRVAAWCYAAGGYCVVHMQWAWQDAVRVGALDLLREV